MRLKYLRIQSDISDHICAIPSCKELNIANYHKSISKRTKKTWKRSLSLSGQLSVSVWIRFQFFYVALPSGNRDYLCKRRLHALSYKQPLLPSERGRYYLLQFQCPPFWGNGKSGGLFLHTDHLWSQTDLWFLSKYHLYQICRSCDSESCCMCGTYWLQWKMARNFSWPNAGSHLTR